ncbi:hypothetical protein [Isoptericola variabilis]|uniref:Integrase n=1 Tax=Isoptericola variabilis (strain 225) TaxID=743718 RepID=F6FW15_ISOV2|nr:hypothetical protein [Isoptericola variabilis]AEG44485.1 integrase [Isoptericola variabilis 225]TWH26601.1 hypothetical protein L600_000600000810 [Isoptericola variabilis J7]
MARTRRAFGQTERRKSARTGKTTGWRARYEGPDGFRYSKTFSTKLDAEVWLAREERLIARGERRPLPQRVVAETVISVDLYAAEQLAVRSLSPRTREEYESYRTRFITGTNLGNAALASVTPAVVQTWLSPTPEN